MNRTPKQFVVNTKGEKKAVILPVEEYEEFLGDLHDLAVVAERRKKNVLTAKELSKRLKKNGVL